MKLSDKSHKKIEEFFRQHFADRNLSLPVFNLYLGRGARLITKTFKIDGITLGRHIFIAPHFLEQDIDGNWKLPFSLVVHEATHVLQYQKMGFIGFLFSYLKAWFAFLRSQRSRDLQTRWQAYYAIPHEEEARLAAAAYQEWRREKAAKEE
jgi:hypothetical protein